MASKTKLSALLQQQAELIEQIKNARLEDEKSIVQEMGELCKSLTGGVFFSSVEGRRVLKTMSNFINKHHQ